MKIKLFFISFFILSFANVIAEEQEIAHQEPSIFDLKYPVLNFVVLVAFLVWKLKKPMADMFNKNAENVKSLMESAEKQSKDANAKLVELENKMKNIQADLTKINTDYESDIVSFGTTLKEETETTIARMKRDVDNKIEGENKELMDGLSHEVLNLVVSNAQSSIKTNTDLKNKATNNIILGLK